MKILFVLLLPVVFLASCSDTAVDISQNDGTGNQIDDTGKADSTRLVLSGRPAIDTFIPTNYILMDTAWGDLNGDYYPDVLLAMKHRNESNFTNNGLDHPSLRPVLLMLGEPNGLLRLVAKNDSALLCKNCGGAIGDPYQRMTIEEGGFSIESFGGSGSRWHHTAFFEWNGQHQKAILVQERTAIYDITQPGKEQVEIKMGKDLNQLAFQNYNVYH